MITTQGHQLLDFLNKLNGFNHTKTQLSNPDGREWFTLKSTNGVVWGGKKWGVMHLENRLFFALDYPPGNFKEEDIVTRIGLPKRNSFEHQSGVRFRTCSRYDTVQITLYPETLNSYSVLSEEFTDFLTDIFNKSSRALTMRQN